MRVYCSFLYVDKETGNDVSFEEVQCLIEYSLLASLSSSDIRKLFATEQLRNKYPKGKEQQI